MGNDIDSRCPFRRGFVPGGLPGIEWPDSIQIQLDLVTKITESGHSRPEELPDHTVPRCATYETAQLFLSSFFAINVQNLHKIGFTNLTLQRFMSWINFHLYSMFCKCTKWRMYFREITVTKCTINQVFLFFLPNAIVQKSVISNQLSEKQETKSKLTSR